MLTTNYNVQGVTHNSARNSIIDVCENFLKELANHKRLNNFISNFYSQKTENQ